MFTSWVAATIVKKGFAHVNDVNSPKPRHDDSGVESFVYSETYACPPCPLLSLRADLT